MEHSVDTGDYQNKIETLLGAFQTRLNQFKADEDNVEFFSNPFTLPDNKIGALEKNLQLEVIDLKCNVVLKGGFAELSAIPSAADMISFWQLLPVTEFWYLHSFAQRFICRFDSANKPFLRWNW